jgi:small-conductance mechanosensitive channel
LSSSGVVLTLLQDWETAVFSALVGIVFAVSVLSLYVRWKKRHQLKGDPRSQMKRSRSLYWVICAFASVIAIFELMAVAIPFIGKITIMIGVATLWLVGIVFFRSRRRPGESSQRAE